MVLPSPNLIATVLGFQIFLCFSNMRAGMESMAPVSMTALQMIEKTESSSLEPPPYPSSGNFTSTPAACRHLKCQLRLHLLVSAFHPAPHPCVWGCVLLFYEWEGLRTFVLQQGHSYRRISQGFGLPPWVYPFWRSYTAPLVLS